VCQTVSGAVAHCLILGETVAHLFWVGDSDGGGRLHVGFCGEFAEEGLGGQFAEGLGVSIFFLYLEIRRDFPFCILNSLVRSRFAWVIGVRD
jgi:hypothetical protein